MIMASRKVSLVTRMGVNHVDGGQSHVSQDRAIAIGGIFVVGVAPLMMLWTDGFAWEPAQSEYEQMIMGIYLTLGVFLILAARDPLANQSHIWFTVWSSLAHGDIMLVQALVDDTERMNLLGDVPAPFVVAAVLG